MRIFVTVDEYRDEYLYENRSQKVFDEFKKNGFISDDLKSRIQRFIDFTDDIPRAVAFMGSIYNHTDYGGVPQQIKSIKTNEDYLADLILRSKIFFRNATYNPYWRF